jgi:hypothetical protein
MRLPGLDPGIDPRIHFAKNDALPIEPGNDEGRGRSLS